MICIKPFVKGGLIPLPCGQCMPCRINSRRVWSSRMYLELCQHAKATFVTLTYDSARLPSGDSLVKRDLSLFFKRLRKSIAPIQIRYFAVGEYGEKYQRPHYHAILYGLGREHHQVINNAWGQGLIHCGDVSPNSISYVAGYVTKKMTAASDPRLKGRAPEFSLMSRNPGIGAKAADQIAHSLTSGSAYAAWLNKNGDVPSVSRQDGKQMPLGRYMVSRIRTNVGFPDGNSPPKKKALYLEEMQALQKDIGKAAFIAAKPFVEWAKADQVIARTKLFAQKRTF